MIEECFAKVEALLGTRAACLAVGRPRDAQLRGNLAGDGTA